MEISDIITDITRIGPQKLDMNTEITRIGRHKSKGKPTYKNMTDVFKFE